MKPIVMGLESEYALSPLGTVPPADRQVDAEDIDCMERTSLVQKLVEFVGDEIPWLRDGQSQGMFMANGARCYVDAGAHPEYSTPECSSPRDAVLTASAGAAILADARDRLEQITRCGITLSHRNVDYATGQTWGCHESYSHAMDPQLVHPKLVPHLVSRIVFTGAGGFDAKTPDVPFHISPRVPHLEHTLSSCSTESRAIIHTKDEPLCREDQFRLHLICGEALYSQRASMLKLGTTALVLRLIDAECMDNDFALVQPVASMKRFSCDTTLSSTAKLRSGKKVTALEIQRGMLERVELAIGESWMPDWSEGICRDWRQTLDQLESDPMSAAPYIDWIAKLTLFEQLRQSSTGQSRADLQNQLYELDARYGEVGERGLGATLEREGLLEPGLFSAAELARARTHAPSGRAARRGEFIRELHSSQSCLRANWHTIVDRPRGRFLPLPLDDAEQGDWEELAPDPLADELDLLVTGPDRTRSLRERLRQTLARRPSADEPELPF